MNVTPAAPPPTLKYPVKDTLVEAQKSQEQARAAIEKRQAEINRAKQELSAAIASGNADPSSVLYVSRQIDIAQAELNKYGGEVKDYTAKLDTALLEVKTSGGLTDAGRARLDEPKYAAVYAGALKKQGVSASSVEASGLDEVKKQFASLGGQTAAGEKMQATPEMKEVARKAEVAQGRDLATSAILQDLDEVTQAGGKPLTPSQAEGAKQAIKEYEAAQYAKTGGLSDFGKSLMATPEMQRITLEAEVERGRVAARNALLQGGDITVRSEREASGARQVVSQVGLELQRQLEEAQKISKKESVESGPTKAGLDIFSDPNYISDVINPAKAQRESDISRSADLALDQFWNRRINLLKEAGYTVEMTEGGFTYFKPGAKPVTNIYEQELRNFEKGLPTQRMPPKSGIVIPETQPKSLREQYLDLATGGGKPPKSAFEFIDRVNAEIIGAGIGLAEGIGRLGLGVGYYVGSRGIKEPLVDEQVNIGVPSGTAGAISAISRRLTGISDVSLGPINLASGKDVEFSRRYPLSAALDVAVDVFLLKGIVTAGAKGLRGAARSVKIGVGKSLLSPKDKVTVTQLGLGAVEEKPFRYLSLSPEDLSRGKPKKISAVYAKAAKEVDAELTMISKTGEPSDFIKAVQDIDRKIYEKITTPKFREPKGGVEMRGRSGSLIAKLEEKTITELKPVQVKAKIATVAKSRGMTKLISLETVKQVQAADQVALRKAAEAYSTVTVLKSPKTKVKTTQKTMLEQANRAVNLDAVAYKPVSEAKTIRKSLLKSDVKTVTIAANKVKSMPVVATVQRRDQLERAKLAEMFRMDSLQGFKQVSGQIGRQRAATKQVSKTVTRTRQGSASIQDQAFKQIFGTATVQKQQAIVRQQQKQLRKLQTTQKTKQVQTRRIPKFQLQDAKDRRRAGGDVYGFKKLYHPIATANEALYGRRRKRKSGKRRKR